MLSAVFVVRFSLRRFIIDVRSMIVVVLIKFLKRVTSALVCLLEKVLFLREFVVKRVNVFFVLFFFCENFFSFWFIVFFLVGSWIDWLLVFVLNSERILLRIFVIIIFLRIGWFFIFSCVFLIVMCFFLMLVMKYSRIVLFCFLFYTCRFEFFCFWFFDFFGCFLSVLLFLVLSLDGFGEFLKIFWSDFEVLVVFFFFCLIR